MNYPDFYSRMQPIDESDESSTTSHSSTDFYEKMKPDSKLKKAARIGGQAAISAAESALFPYLASAYPESSKSVRTFQSRQSSFEDIESLGKKKRKGKITPEEEQELQELLKETESPLNTFSKMPEGESDLLRSALGKLTKEDLTPKGGLETAASFASILKDFPKAVASAIKKGKLQPKSKEANELLKWGKQKGISDKELAPLLHSKSKTYLLGKTGLRTQRAEKSLGESEDALSNIYEYLYESGSKGKMATNGQSESLFNHFQKISDKIKLSAAPTADEKMAVEMIDDMINRFAAGGVDPARLMATIRSINQTVNWKAVRGGKKILGALQDPMKELLNKLDPKISKDFNMVNKAWGKLKDVSKHIGPKEATKFEEYGKIGVLASALTHAAATGNTTALKAIIGAKAGGLLATEMLINPNLNHLMQKTLGTMANGSKSAVKRGILELKKGLEKYPEIHQEIDWDQFEE